MCKCKWDGDLQNGRLKRCKQHQDENNQERSLWQDYKAALKQIRKG